MKSHAEWPAAHPQLGEGLIQQQIRNPLATEILKREFGEGSRVKIDHVDGEFTFERVD